MKIKSFILALCCTLYAAEAASQILREHVVDGLIYPLIDCTGLPEGMLMEKDSADLAFAGRVVVRHYGKFDHAAETFTIDNAHKNFCPNNKIVPQFIVSFTNFDGVKPTDNDWLGTRADWATASGYTEASNESSSSKPVEHSYNSCARLSENGLAWRLPTIRELEIIFTFKPELEKFEHFAEFSPRQYWSSTEFLLPVDHGGGKTNYIWALTRGFMTNPEGIQQTSSHLPKEPMKNTAGPGTYMSFRCVATVWTK